MIKKLIFLLLTVFSLLFTACAGSYQPAQASASPVANEKNRDIILQNDYTNTDRNRLLREDIEFFANQLPKAHKNPFSIMTRQEFENRTSELAANVETMTNMQVFTELNKIIALIGDAHTSINYWDGSLYPLKFWLFDEKVYIINADRSLEKMLYSEVVSINGVDINEITQKLTELISHENESWVMARLPDYLSEPVYMHGLGIIDNKNETVFTVINNGEEQNIVVPIFEYGEKPDFCAGEDYPPTSAGGKNYTAEYLAEHKTMYFEYNICAEMSSLKFSTFNDRLFEAIEQNETEKIIIDLRRNTGGNSEVLNPFTQKLRQYILNNKDVKVYVLVGRFTFSSGMFAIYRIKDAVPEAVTIGEPTGGAIDCYGDILSFELPNSRIPIYYSTKYFNFSKSFKYKNKGIGTFLPDITITQTFEDYVNHNDTVLNFLFSE